MLSFNVDVEVIDENGDTTWAEVKVAPTDDDTTKVEFTPGFTIGADDVVVFKLADLDRALTLVVDEHGRRTD